MPSIWRLITDSDGEGTLVFAIPPPDPQDLEGLKRMRIVFPEGPLKEDVLSLEADEVEVSGHDFWVALTAFSSTERALIKDMPNPCTIFLFMLVDRLYSLGWH
jgi:hypothetical protein